MGLSPRMRGNRVLALDDLGVERSIPAYAGEPRLSSWRAVPAQVYPRVCGGTDGQLDTNRLLKGLSPRMRGNRSHHCRQ